MKNSPLVSICIPVYNAEKFIKDAIVSCLQQSYKNIEVIIVDNLSTDRSFEIAKTFSDSRIRVFRNSTNIGMCGNWNICLKHANGEFIKILPADDLLNIECIKEQVNIFNTHEDISLVCCSRKVMLDSGKVLFSRKFKFFSEGIYTKNKIQELVVRSGTNIIGEPGSVLFKSSAARSAGDFDENSRYVIDLEYWLRLIRDENLYFLEKALASFRLNSGSQSVAMLKTQARDVIRLINTFMGQVGYPRWLAYFKVYRNVALRYLFYKFYL